MRANPITAFIVHGRDLDALHVLTQTLNSLGIEVRLFKDVANSFGGTPYVADVVSKGISECDICIVLFTPDEIAAYYDPKSGDLDETPGASRWQARANVIFEAGIAFGSKQSRTLFVTIGKHKEVFSDIGGMHVQALDDASGRQSLAARIQDTLPNTPAFLVKDKRLSPASFASVTRERWPFYDEITGLEKALAEAISPKSTRKNTSLLTVIRTIVTQNLIPRSQGKLVNWDQNSTEHLFECLTNRYRSKPLHDWAFWELLHHGFVQVPRDDPYWLNEDSSNPSNWIPCSQIAMRGLALIEKLRSQYPQL